MMIPVLVVKLLLLRGVLGDIPNACPTSPDANATVCRHDECVLIADELLETMNNSRDPCQNFYQYACGGWLDRQFLNSQRQRVTTFESTVPLVLTRAFLAEAPTATDLPSVQKAKNLYASCISFTNTTSPNYTDVIDVIVEKFAMWPLICKNCSGTSFSLEPSLLEARKLGVQPLFTMQADPSSFTDPEKRQLRSSLYVGKPVLGMPIDHYKVLSRYEPYRKIYANKIIADAKKFRNFTNTLMGLQDALELITVEVHLAMLYNNLTNTGITVNMTLQQLNAEYGQLINWTRFVSSMASSPEVGITDITPQEVVIVSDPEYLRQMTDYFTALPTRIQENYLYWRVIDSLQYVLIEDHRKLKFYLTVEAASKTTPYPYTELDCVRYVSEVFDLVVHRFLYKALRIDTINTTINIIQRMKNEFKNVVSGHIWMNTDTKRTVMQKVDALQTIFSFHENSMNDSVLDSFFSDITVDWDNFISAVVQARKAAFARDLKNIRRTKEADPTVLPHQFVAEYSRKLNKLYISPIVLHHPFYNDIGYWSLVFAGLGTVVAQEIMRGFDTTGYRYNSSGGLGDWWDEYAAGHFLENAHCLINEYDNFFYNIAGMHINGTLTLDSNIADVTGLKIAYKAYKDYISRRTDLYRLPGVTLSNEQAFFVKFAQMRCTKETTLAGVSTLSGKQSPDEFRVNGPLRNLPEFARAFNCPADSFMNPPNKCEVW